MIPRAAQAAPLFTLCPIAFSPVFFTTTITEYGHLEEADRFNSVEEAESALELMELALDDRDSYTLRCAIAELREQLADYYSEAENKES